MADQTNPVDLICCALEGDVHSDPFCVGISRSTSIARLIRDITEAYAKLGIWNLSNVDVYQLDYTEDEYARIIAPPPERLLSKLNRVGDYWTTPGEKLIHVLVHVKVQPSNLVPASSQTQQNVPPTDDGLRELTEKFKNAQLGFIKSLAARSSARAAEIPNFREQQATSNFIRNGRPATHTGLPIVLYHPVFGQFLSNLQSTDPVPAATYVRTIKYFPISQNIYQSESHEAPNWSGLRKQQSNDRDRASRGVLSSLWGCFPSGSSAPGTQPDGLTTGHDGACLIMVETNNEIGAGGSDPSIRAAQSYSRYWGNSRARDLLDKCCCPSILVAIAGPWMTILGAVFLDRPVIQPLTDLLWIGHDPARPSQLAYITRALHSVYLARESLEEFYCNVPVLCRPLDRFFPYVTRYTDLNGRRVEFTYLKALSEKYPTNDISVFLAETRNVDEPKQIIVKFVQTYNAEAHNLLAESGFAPTLLYNGFAYPGDQPGPDHTMIVMEFLHGTDLSKFNTYPLPECVFTDIDKALEHLHDHDFVFGDLRDPNVMIVVDSLGVVTGAQLIDFDWCGKHQVGRYPFSMNPDVNWAAGVEPGGLMDMKHDIEMRRNLRLIF